MKTKTKTQILSAITSAQIINLVIDIDSTYGQWSETFIPVNNGYNRIINGASNWTYCGCCGNPYYNGVQNCNCEKDYSFVSNHEVFAMLKKQRENVYID